MKPTMLLLVGPAGSGKSTAGAVWAKQHEAVLFDVDAEICRKSGSTIDAIFRTQGESGFRHLETETFRDVLRQASAYIYQEQKSVVIVTGGGWITKSENWAIFEDEITHNEKTQKIRNYVVYYVVHLNISAKSAAPRILQAQKNDAAHRPLYTGTLDEIEQAWRQREEIRLPLRRQFAEQLDIQIKKRHIEKTKLYSYSLLSFWVEQDEQFLANSQKIHDAIEDFYMEQIQTNIIQADFLSSYQWQAFPEIPIKPLRWHDGILHVPHANQKVVWADSAVTLVNTSSVHIEKLENREQKTKIRIPLLCFVDQNVVNTHFYQEMMQELQDKNDVKAVILLEGGESCKEQTTLFQILSACAQHLRGRHGCLLAVGGGAVLDVVGLAASLWSRGTSWIAVPTTLLSMVDASVGGKTAINLPEGKNLVGTFHPPIYTYINTQWLSTLPKRQLQAGCAEMLKHVWLTDVLQDQAALRSTYQTLIKILDNPCSDEMKHSIQESIAIKAAVVDMDPQEKNLRKVLNLGHTVGHALEKLSMQEENPENRLEHGEAVAYGLDFIAWISGISYLYDVHQEWMEKLVMHKKNVCTGNDEEQAEKCKKIKSILCYDKKRDEQGGVQWIVPIREGTQNIAVARSLAINATRQAQIDTAISAWWQMSCRQTRQM